MNIDCLNMQMNRGMNMEMLIGGSLAAFVIYTAANWKTGDSKKIAHTFKNIGYKVKDHTPKLLKIHKTDKYTTYTYNVPYGLIDDPKLNVLEKVLNKPIKISFVNQKLQIKVYAEKLPAQFNYDWKATEGWSVPIGKSQEQTIIHDFDKIPHMTIAGMTRQGKTVLLKLIFAHLINNHPDDVEFYIIDLKGGLEFNQYRNLKQVKYIASDVNEAYVCLQFIQKQIKADMKDFKDKGYTNILHTGNQRRRIVIVDEGAELAPAPHHDKSDRKKLQHCQHVLSEVCRVAGALGYRNIFCTQYPTGGNHNPTLPRQIKQNSDAKISFRLPTEIASRVAIDEQGAENISNIGRAIYRTHEKHILQVPYINDVDIKDKLKEWEEIDDSTNETTAEGRNDIVEL